ncbi:MAG: histidine decarboxylase, pyruvoyl type [Cetobacterium sp.]|uniref:histidine decarboxylase, pyruvoyl type n=1 Tax=unclassified Cetobacterium TaxID=2630983 RepID=UPI00163BA0B7|nr:histidine decarboxylase, pyruvoyl type [Cetobacterium sp. 2A]MBC2855875.1 histidine decarboxylase, pyruvoyl type [Cetobacterium sp. 2A]
MRFDKTAISFYDDYCDGYGSPGSIGNGYVNILKVSAGTVKKTDDILIDGIVAYDRAEVNDAYIGQINMLTASSFCGLVGQVWGHDLAKHDSIAEDKIQPLFEVKQYDGSILNVYDGKPLLDAGVELFGTESNRRFPPIPGSHMTCANKGVTSYRPADGTPLKDGQSYGVWCFIAISIAKDRTKDASLFIEDAGLWTKNDNPKDLVKFLEDHRKAVVWSVAECGKDSHVIYERTYVSFAYVMMKPGEIGTSLTCGPYVTLARNAIPEAGFDSLNKLTLSEWLTDRKLTPILK